jgi:hypothetical protein
MVDDIITVAITPVREPLSLGEPPRQRRAPI